MFYIVQYSLSNLNAFVLILTIGYSLYCYVYDAKLINAIKEENTEDTNKSKKEKQEIVSSKGESNANSSKINSNEKYGNLTDINNSPIQLIDQLKGYYYVNPIISLSLGITLFSFAGIPPLIGFFGKQIILSAAIDNGYIFMSLVAILTSVISAVYYLAVIKQIFFDKKEYKLIDELKGFNIDALITENNTLVKKVNIDIKNIVISSSLSLPISVLTLVITLFIFIPQEVLNLANILSLIIFNL
jgi:NADH-ubiquinone oxidoreductase chain 2